MKSRSRRAFLKGAGTVAISLPFADFVSESLGSQRIYAQEAVPKSKKFVTAYFPNGSLAEYWNLENALKPLAGLKDNLIVLGGVRNPVTEKNQRDAHEQGAAALFTGASLKNDQVGTMISLDQFLSIKLDGKTYLKKPLVTGVWRGFAGGQFRTQSWYRRSWLENGEPVTPMIKPLEIFRTILGDQTASQDMKKALLDRKRSVLDTIVKQMKSLTSDASQLPSSHKSLLVNHLDRVRDMEKRVIDLENNVMSQCSMPISMPMDVKFDSQGLLPYEHFESVYRLQMDLIALALQCEVTNTASLMFCCAGEEYLNPKVSAQHTDHGTSHFFNEETKNIYLRYRQYHAENLLYFIEKLKEAGLREQTTIVYGSEFGDGTNHQISPQPHLIYSGGESGLKLGQSLDLVLTKNTNADVYATLLKGLGFEVPIFGEREFNSGLVKAMLK